MKNSAPVFYDCEASGIGGFVIEIGWAFMPPDERKTVSDAYASKTGVLTA
jgi:hypothetical protein